MVSRSSVVQTEEGSSRLDRRRARAWALQIHYRWESEGPIRPLEEVLFETLRGRKVASRRVPFLRRLIEAVEHNRGDIDAQLTGSLQNWELGRLSSIDRGILRIAAAEMLFMPDVPQKVSIQEAIQIAEGYGGPRSPAFVNGVLDALMHAVADDS